jgi:hypothetical protein
MAENSELKTEPEEKPVSLKDFIDDHQKMIAVIGVFMALAVFWSNLPLNQFSSVASFWCLIATTPLYFEIYKNYLQKKSTLSLTIFLNLFTPIMYYTTKYVFIAFRPQWKDHMINLILWIFVIPAWLLYKKIDIRKKLEKSSDDMMEKALTNKEWSEKNKEEMRVKWGKERIGLINIKHSLINFTTIVIFLIIGTIVAYFTSNWLNGMLDQVYSSYKVDNSQGMGKSSVLSSPTVVPSPKNQSSQSIEAILVDKPSRCDY